MAAGRMEGSASSGLDNRIVVIPLGAAPGDLAVLRAPRSRSWLVPAPTPSASPSSTPADLSSTRAALQGAPLAVLVVNTEGELVWHNEALARLLREEVPRQLVDLMAGAEGTIDGPDRGNRLACARGPTPVQVLAWRVQDGDASLLALSLQEVSQEVWVRSLLDEARRWQERLLENETDAVVILDAQGAVLAVGPAVGLLLERDTAEWPGRPLPLAFAEDRARARRAIEEVLASPARRAPLRWRIADGRERVRWMEGILSNQLGNPLVQGLVLESRDATEQQELHAALRREDRMRSASLLGATVAHDMNNMVGVLVAGLERSGVLAEAESEALRRISELARRLLAVGKVQGAEARRVDLGRVVTDLRALFLPLLRSSQQLSIELDPGEHPVLVDVGMLEQALVNLVINARDAMGPQGRLCLRVRRSTRADRPTVAVDIQDDGTGMDKETLARIFEPFFTTKAAGQGSGLGMVVVQGFVHDHQGTVEIRSSPGAGTCFTISLPIDING